MKGVEGGRSAVSTPVRNAICEEERGLSVRWRRPTVYVGWVEKVRSVGGGGCEGVWEVVAVGAEERRASRYAQWRFRTASCKRRE